MAVRREREGGRGREREREGGRDGEEGSSSPSQQSTNHRGAAVPSCECRQDGSTRRIPDQSDPGVDTPTPRPREDRRT